MKAVVVGAGGIGQQIAQKLGEAGHEVVLASRSGTGIGADVSTTPSAAVSVARVDAADLVALHTLATGADVLVNAVNPPYTRWPELWPPMATAFLGAAERSGAGLMIVGNLYGYGPVAAPMTESTPLATTGVKGGVRARMWRDALEADQAGRLRAVELRASDYFGPGATEGMSYLNQYAIAPAVRGRTAQHVRGDMDAPHSWTYLSDIARLAVAVAGTDRAGVDWGRVWHVPTAAPVTMREVSAQVAEIAGVAAHQPRLYPWLIRKALRVVPLIRELDETDYQFDRSFILDSSEAQSRFGLAPTLWRDALAETVRWMKAQG
ncbi:MAG: NAD-dependent epimerase/dehydratase family protein [Propionibacteriaceae bacterium]